jgi:hypothetical protein
MLDTFEAYAVDSTWLGRALEALPGSYPGPRQPLLAPYAVLGFGEGAWPAEVARGLLAQNGHTTQGSQIVLLGGMDFGDADAANLIAAGEGLRPYRIGHEVWRSLKLADHRQWTSTDELDHTVPASPLSAYTYLQALAYATGNFDWAETADALLLDLRDRCASGVPSEHNPAKTLAWSLWTRTPVLLATREHAPQVWAWQVHLARIAKTLAVPVERDALTVLASGFEARHETGDRLVALLLGGEDRVLQLASEVLKTRVDEVIVVPAEHQNTYAASLGLWYLGAWVSYYLAVLYKTDPKDATPLEKLRAI